MPTNQQRESTPPATGHRGLDDRRFVEAPTEAEQRMRRRVDLLWEVVWETDSAGRLVYLNRAWDKVLGHPVDQSLGRRLEEFVETEDQGVLEIALGRLLAAEAGEKPWMRFRRADGGVVWMEISVSQLPEGGLVGVLRDVRTEKQARDELAKLSLLASFTENFVIITNREGRVEWVNPAFTKRTGYTLADMVGKKPGSILQGTGTDARTIEELRARLREGRSFHADLLNYTRAGEPYWVSFYISPIRDEAGRVERFVSVQTEVTELHRTQQELEAARTRAETMAMEAQAANQAKSEFLANMSHEIRTPMNGILGMAELLQKTALDNRQRELADSIGRSGTALLGIINNIFDLSQIEAGRVVLEQVEFAPAQLINSVVGGLAGSGHGKPVVVRAECDPAVPERVLGDVVRLRQVLQHLAGNGLKFTSAGRVVVRLGMAEQTGNQVRLRFEVVDTGVGIPQAKNALLFKPFQPLDSSTVRRHGGMGLGLAIARRLVELMGGNIGLESEEGKGANFWFELPFTFTPPTTAPAPAASAPLTGWRVLVAQESHLSRRLLLLSLARLGCETETAVTGPQVFERLEGTQYDAVVFDPLLPEVAGGGLPAAIREWEGSGGQPPRPPLRLIALQARVSPSRPAEAAQPGGDTTLTGLPSLQDLKQALLGTAEKK